MTKKVNGFTLIELLVVISIISLLLSILMPALGKVRGQARTLVCKSNLRTLTAAMLSYTTENKDTFARALTPSIPGAIFASKSHIHVKDPASPGYNWYTTDGLGELWDWDSWMDQLWRFMNKPALKVFVCPSALGPRAPLNTWWPDKMPSYGYNSYVSDAYTGWVGTAYGTRNGYGEGKPSRIFLHKSPSNSFVFMDFNIGWSTAVIPKFFQNWAQVYHPQFTPHNRGTNFSFADGHIETIEYGNPKVYSESSNWHVGRSR